MMLSIAFLLISVSAVANDHPQQITVNGKAYDWPNTPLVLVLIDGGDPAYAQAAVLNRRSHCTGQGFP